MEPGGTRVEKVESPVRRLRRFEVEPKGFEVEPLVVGVRKKELKPTTTAAITESLSELRPQLSLSKPKLRRLETSLRCCALLLVGWSAFFACFGSFSLKKIGYPCHTAASLVESANSNTIPNDNAAAAAAASADDAKQNDYSVSKYEYDDLMKQRVMAAYPNVNAASLKELKNDYSVAKYESYGFFDGITASDWDLMKQRVKDVYPNVNAVSLEALKNNRNIRASDFYQDHFEPDFACRHERRIGQKGDGGKWVCDPHRLYKQQKEDCLVYSVGSEGDASFEKAVKEEIGSHCEIHTFDMGDYKNAVEKSGSNYHQWGIAPTSQENGRSFNGKQGVFKTLEETMKLLNHTGRSIDLFKIDCEYCEWDVFPAFFGTGVHLQQILIELHAFRKPLPMPKSVDFFQEMFNHGYVIFHKEVNIKHWDGEAIEYGFFKLRPDFFESMNITDQTGKITARRTSVHANTFSPNVPAKTATRHSTRSKPAAVRFDPREEILQQRAALHARAASTLGLPTDHKMLAPKKGLGYNQS